MIIQLLEGQSPLQTFGKKLHYLNLPLLDPLPSYRIGFDATEYTVSETGGSIVLTVTVLSGMLDQPVFLTVMTQDGTATGTRVTCGSSRSY